MERHIDKLRYTEAYGEQGHTYTFTDPCRVTGEEYSVTVKGPELFRMRQTNSIMALASLDAGDREFLISGTSPKKSEKPGMTNCNPKTTKFKSIIWNVSFMIPP